MKLPTTTRRALLGALPATAAGVALPGLALAATPTDRRAWNAAMIAHKRVRAEQTAFDPVWDRVHTAWEAGRPSMDAIHWKEFSFADRHHTARIMDLDKAWKRFLDGENKFWWGEDHDAIKRKHRAALDSIQAFREAEAKHNRESGMDAADERSDELSERYLETDRALMDMPAPDLAALRWKLDVLFEPDSGGESTPGWSRDYVRQTLADIVRLLPGEA